MSTIFLRIAWMKHYQGVSKNDIPTGAGSYVEENHDGGEVYNFQPSTDGYMFGYVHIQDYKAIRLERIGAEREDDYINGVTIVFFAKNPQTGGQYVVGWHKNATLYRNEQAGKAKGIRANGRRAFRAKARVKDCRLIHEDDRSFELPFRNVGGPGQSNVWYVENYNDPKYMKNLEEYIKDPAHCIDRKPKKGTRGRPWQKDVELKKRIETGAMDIVAEYFQKRNYTVEYKHTENLGWDLEAKLRNQTLLLEVKGLSGSFNSVELTHNEYINSKRNKTHYRLCIVANVLDTNNRKLDIYYYKDRKWTNNNNQKLVFEEIVSARVYPVVP